MEFEKKIFVLNHARDNIWEIVENLKNAYQIISVQETGQLVRLLREEVPSLLMCSGDMAEKENKVHLEQLQKEGLLEKIPMICWGEPQQELICLQKGAVLFLTFPMEVQKARIYVDRIIQLYEDQQDLEKRINREVHRVEQVTLQAIMAIADAEDAKDTYTNEHSFRVANYAARIASKLGWDEASIERIQTIGLLHDIGKIGIPDHILNKHSGLTEAEYAQMKQHVQIGADILSKLTSIQNLAVGALYHHERWDGKGYIHGLKGEEIPIEARIIGIADAYDAMSSDRTYSKIKDTDYVINEIRRGAGQQFDPKLVDIMLEVVAEERG